jgi:cobalt/nickel transport system permease protein
MAHLPDGVLSLPVLAAGAAVATAGCAWGLRRLDAERIPHAAMAAAACFVAALVHFPVGVGSVHLILNGLAGVLLGWAAFPVVAVATFLQMLMFGFGGFAALGVNIADMALPAVIAGGLFRLAAARFGLQNRRTALVAGLAGGLAPALTAAMISAALVFSGKEWTTAARLIFLTHAPVILIEAFVTAAAVGLALRVKPEIFAESPPREAGA